MKKSIDWRRVDCANCEERFLCDKVQYDCPLEDPPLINLLDISVLADTTKNFTPADLMQRYPKQNPAAVFDRGPYGEALLILGGIVYKYHHWNIGDGYVILTLEEVKQ
jgi:hypothetical protein